MGPLVTGAATTERRFSLPTAFLVVASLGLRALAGEPVPVVLAGDETALPVDFPSKRLDPLGPVSPFNAVGALQITAAGYTYRGSAVAISSHWVLTAGHNLDLNDNGAPDPGISISLHLPGFGVYPASGFYTHPFYSGFGNPSIQRDLGLLYIETPLPAQVAFPSLFSGLHIGQRLTMVGFGRSGYGSYGYTTSSSLTDRRIGHNVLDWLSPDDRGGGFAALFRYDFDAPENSGQLGGSLGNDLESLIGPGDSGGPLLVDLGGTWGLAGINTFTEGYGGQFGDIGGGIVLAPYLEWITSVTGIAVPEPGSAQLLIILCLMNFLKRKKPLAIEESRKPS